MNRKPKASPAEGSRELQSSNHATPSTEASLVPAEGPRKGKRVGSGSALVQASTVDAQVAPAPAPPPPPRIPSVRVTKTGEKTYSLGVDAGDRAGNRQTTGSDSDAFSVGLLASTVDAAVKIDHEERTVNGALAAMAELGPRDALEGLLVSQASTLHFLGLHLAGQAGTSGPRQLDYARTAVNVLRASAEALEKLDRRRRGPSVQKIQVERLTLEGNAQAVIGTAQVGGGSRGVNP